MEKETLLKEIEENDLKECVDGFNNYMEFAKGDINKIDIFWLEALNREVKEVLKKSKKFNSL